MKRFIAIAVALAAFGAYAVTATKGYVDRRDAEILKAAKDYADAHGGGGPGSTDGQAVTNIVSGMVDGKFIPTKVKADVVVDLYPETDQGYIPRSITFLSEHQILRLDADYDDGAALFGSMAEFRSKAVYRLHYVDEYCSEDIGDASILYSNGVETMTKDKRWFFLSYPEKSGTLATTDDVAEAVKDVKASAVNLEDKALGRKWELTANDGVFTFTLIEEPAK